MLRLDGLVIPVCAWARIATYIVVFVCPRRACRTSWGEGQQQTKGCREMHHPSLSSKIPSSLRALSVDEEASQNASVKHPCEAQEWPDQPKQLIYGRSWIRNQIKNGHHIDHPSSSTAVKNRQKTVWHPISYLLLLLIRIRLMESLACQSVVRWAHRRRSRNPDIARLLWRH